MSEILKGQVIIPKALVLQCFYRTSALRRITQSHITYYSHMFFIAYHPLGAVDDLIGRSRPQHLGGDSFDCCSERYEMVVYSVGPGQLVT